jgi:hypothetical protein
MDQPYTDPNLGPLQRQGTITIRPVAGNPDGDAWAAFPDAAPEAPKAKGAVPGNVADPWAQYSDTAPTPKAPGREIGAGEATARGVIHGLTFGTGPALAGAQDAANPDIQAAARKFGIDPETATNFLDHLAPTLKTLYGAGRLAHDAIAPPERKLSDLITGDTSTPAQKAYEATRQKESAADTAASEQHPYLYGASELAGSLAAPIPGAGALKAATTAVRIGRGIKSGAAAGGLFGFGEAVGEGKSLPESLESAGKGAAIGGAVGGPLGAVLGPKVAKVATTPGEKAAETAAALGAPLPRGLASDSPFVQATTQQARQVPWAGKRIDLAAGKTVGAAGNKVGEIVDTLTPAAERSATDTALQTPLQDAITNNKAGIDTAYDALRQSINPDQRIAMPHTQAAISAVKLARQRAGWQNPGEGLGQAENLATQGGGFNGAHRLRRDLRDAGKSASPHPGYNKGDFSRIAKAVDADLKDIIRKSSTNPNRSESLFHTAELTAKQHIVENELLQKLLDAKGEGAVATLFGSAKEKGGNLELLAQIKHSVPQASFDRIAGSLLNEIGHNNSTGHFSLAQFATGWDKLSPGAKGILFSPDHRKWIDDIVELGRHIKGGDQYRNTSNTAGALILFDILKTAAETGVGVTAGVVSPAAAGAVAAGALAADLLTRYLASPAKAASMSAWARAYRGITLNQPTPARIAAFKIATRNLANNVNVPVDRIMSIVDQRIGRAGVNADEQKND